MNEGKHLSSEELFKRHARFVARFLARMGVRNNDLDDLIQEVFLVAHRNGGYRPGSASPTTYLAGIAVRVRSVYVRKQMTRKWIESNSDALKCASSRERDPLETLLRQVDEKCFKEALDTLDSNKRAVFVLVEVEDESCPAVAAGLGIPVNTVHSRLRGARQRFCKAARAAVEKSEWSRDLAPRPDARQREARAIFSKRLKFGGRGNRTDVETYYRITRSILSPG